MKNNNIIEFLKRILSNLIYGILLVYLLIRKRLKKECLQNLKFDIAIIFFAGLGDFIVLCNSLRQLYEHDVNMILICPFNNGVSELANKLGYFNKIYSLNNRYIYRIKNINILFEICSEKAVTMPAQRHVLTDIYNLAVDAKIHISADTNLGCSSVFLKKLLDKRMSSIIKIDSTLEIDRYAEYFNGIGYSYVESGIFEFEKKQIQKIYTAKKYIISIFPGASGSLAKCWPLDNYIWIINNLSLYKNIEFKILGTKKEIEIGKKIMNGVSNDIDVLNLCGKTEMDDLLKYINSSILVIANDSGSAHLSIACKIPTIVIAGLWEYGRFYPNNRLDKIHKIEIVECSDFLCANCRESQPKCSRKGEPAECVSSVKREKVLYDLKNKLEEIYNADFR